MTDGSLLFIGTATTLIRYAGITLLTDPNFIHAGESVPVGIGLSTTRLTNPAMELDELPELDAVLLSHYHGDHFDRVAEERLDRGLAIITTPEAAQGLEEKGFRMTAPLETWQSLDLRSPEGRVRITALPARHAPAGVDLIQPQTMGSYLEFWGSADDAPRPPDLRMYITGDTVMYEGIDEIAQRMPEVDLALLHLGGTRVLGITITLDAEQGVDVLEAVRPGLAVPIHYDDYDVFKSPLEDFVAEVRAANLEDGVRYLERGESLTLPPARASVPGARVAQG